MNWQTFTAGTHTFRFDPNSGVVVTVDLTDDELAVLDADPRIDTAVVETEHVDFRNNRPKFTTTATIRTVRERFRTALTAHPTRRGVWVRP